MTTRTKIFIEATPVVPVRRSGIGHATLEIIRELDKDQYSADYDVTVFVPLGESRALKRYNLKNVNIRQLPFPHKLFSLLAMLRISIPIDPFLGKGVYIFPNYRNLPLLFSKSLTFVHDVCYKIYPEYINPRNLIYLQKNMPRWLKRTDRVITISESSKREIISKLDVESSKIDVVELGVDPSVFFPRTQNEIDKVCKENDLVSKGYFLFIGNIEPRKNLSFLVNTYSNQSDFTNTSLFLVGGDGWLNDTIIEDINKAVEAGYDVRRNNKYVEDDDLPALISGAIAVVLPSIHEGFGLSCVQARACGTPVIASDIPVLREVGSDDVIYFKNTDKKSLLHALNQAFILAHQPPSIDNTWASTVSKILTSADRLNKSSIYKR